MNSSGDSAEQVVRLSLEGMEVAFKIAGESAKNIAVMIYTIMQNKQQTKGKTRLTNMLKAGKPLKIFTIRAEDLKKFSQEAKKYGVLYCALADKKNEKIDGMVDIMVREEDASKINRISERFNFTRIDTGSIEREMEKETQKQEEQKPQNEELQEKSEDDKFIDDILVKPIQKEEEQQEQQEEINPSNTPSNSTEEKNQLENSLNTKLDDKKITKGEDKKSVRKELKEIEQELATRRETQEITKINEKGKHFKQSDEERKPKHFKEPKHLDNSHKTKKKKSKNRERSK